MPTYITVDADRLEEALAELEARPSLLASRAVSYLRDRLDEAPRHRQAEELPIDTGELAKGNLAALPVAHHHPDHATSVNAAEHIALTVGSLRVRALEQLAAAGSDGLTDVELEDRLQVRRPTGGNRRGELVKIGAVQEATGPDGSPVLREVPGHLPAKVWRVTELGAELLGRLGHDVDRWSSATSWGYIVHEDPAADPDHPRRYRAEVLPAGATLPA